MFEKDNKQVEGSKSERVRAVAEIESCIQDYYSPKEISEEEYKQVLQFAYDTCHRISGGGRRDAFIESRGHDHYLKMLVGENPEDDLLTSRTLEANNVTLPI